jgi:hypothetical protein
LASAIERAMTARYAKVFDLKSCRDLLGKLERELVRLEYSLDRCDRADHAANFAIWAWRLTDWVYAQIAARAPLRKRFAEACDTSVDALDLRGFRRYLQGPQGCPGLACCRAIATAAKDAESGDDQPPPDETPASAVIIVLHPAASGGRPTVELAEWQASQWLLWAGDDGEAVPDVELFQDVLQFWTDFIHANHIA